MLQQLTTDLNVKSHMVGTVGFRAPEITMRQDYNQSVDIFSLGVVLFIMLTGQRPFRRVFRRFATKDNCNSTQQQVGKRYSLLFSNTKQYWGKYIGYNTIVHGKAKDLLLQMLEFDYKRRILMYDIMQHEWYSGTRLENGAQLQQHIHYLLNMKVHDLNQVYDDEKHSANSTLKSQSESLPVATSAKQLVHSFSSVPLCPVSIDETDPSLVFTKNNKQLVFDSLKDNIEHQLQGTVHFDKCQNVLICTFPQEYKDDCGVKTMVEFATRMYLSRRWNSYSVWHSLNVKSESTDTKEEPIYLVVISEIDGREDILETIKPRILKILESANCQSIGALLSDLVMINHISQTQSTNPNVCDQVHNIYRYSCAWCLPYVCHN